MQPGIRYLYLKAMGKINKNNINYFINPCCPICKEELTATILFNYYVYCYKCFDEAVVFYNGNIYYTIAMSIEMDIVGNNYVWLGWR